MIFLQCKTYNKLSIMTNKNRKHWLGIILIVVAVIMLVYDYISPPIGEISNVTLVMFAKLTAIAGSLMNLDFNKVKNI